MVGRHSRERANRRSERLLDIREQEANSGSNSCSQPAGGICRTGCWLTCNACEHVSRSGRPESIQSALLFYAGGTASAQLLQIAALPVLARWYSPSTFGVYGAVIAAVSVITMASTLRLEIAAHVA